LEISDFPFFNLYERIKKKIKVGALWASSQCLDLDFVKPDDVTK